MEGERIIEPLLYIDQPTLQKPKAYMQEDYMGLKPTIKTDENEVSKEEESKDKNNEEGSFKDLSINQKIDYLVNLPSEVPRIRCEVITEEQGYRGTIIEEVENVVLIRVIGRGRMKINKDDIQNINLIGF